VPTIYPVREMAVDGGLISYGTNLAHAYYEVGVYGALILKERGRQTSPYSRR
jgi:hypothetical protein